LHGNARTQKMVETIRTAALRGADLTSRLLAYSRKQTLRPEPVDFNRLVVGMGEMMRRVLGEHIQVESVLAGGLWSAMADAAQLENAILNLAVNARDAMPGGGKLTLETANIRLDEHYAVEHPDVRPGRYVMLAVTDTGEGMAPETIKRAFEPFFTTKEPGKGSGLGLSMVYGFVKQSGGHVKIYSEPSRGTAVKIYLPCTELPGKTDAPTLDNGQALPVGTERILVVEDDDLVRRTVVHQLKGLGYEVLEAGHGAAALDILLGPEPVDLLFTDVVMPGGMMGRELATRALQLRKQIRVLYTSGYTENSMAHQGALDPKVAILAKPYTRDALARKIRAALDGTG
jgi:CheY-like chemotaxis protein